MNSIFSRTFKALCAVALMALLSACGGASSTVDPFTPKRIIAFGDGFSYVDGNGYGLSTVRTNEVDNTIVGRIAARVGIVVKAVSSNPLAATGGFSYASPKARVADVGTQINTFLTDAGGVVGDKDMIIITVGNWDVYDAVMSNANMDTAATNLVTAVKRLTNAGAKHVVLIPAINMARTPWALTAPNSKTLQEIQMLGITTATLPSLTSLNYLMLLKIADAYKEEAKPPVKFKDRSGDFNSFAGKFDTNGSTRILNMSGMAITADTGLYVPICAAAASRVDTDSTFATGCALPGTTDYQTYVFADDINLTPLANRFLADRTVVTLISEGWLP